MAEQERAFLNFLLEANSRQAKLLLEHSTPAQLQALGEICYNILHGEIASDLIKQLQPYKLLIRQLSDKTSSSVIRRKIAGRKAKSVTELLRLVESILP